jgi:PAP2 superfamily
MAIAARWLAKGWRGWIAVGNAPAARAHARWIAHLENALQLAIEGPVQRALDSGAAIWVLNNLYLVAQLAVVPGALIWLYARSPAIYRALRNTVLASWLIAVPIYALFPVAPPRLAGIGIVDTMSKGSGASLNSHLATSFYNPLAAVPSLHAGFAFGVGTALVVAARRRWAKALALLWTPAVTLAVVATGNHFLFDIAAGLLVTALAFTAVRMADRLIAGRSRRGAPRALAPLPASSGAAP